MAQGVYFTFNSAKRNVLKALYDVYPGTLTSLQISQMTGMEYGNTRRLMTHYAKSNRVKYIKRLKVRGDNNAFRFKINKSGVRYLFEYTKRMKLGIGCNLRKNKIVYMETYHGVKSVKIRSDKDLELTPAELAPYVRISKRGALELGVTPENKLKIAGILRDKVLDEPHKKPSEPKVKKPRGRPPKQKKELKESVENEIKVYFVPEVVANRLVPFFNKPTVLDLSEMPETRSKPSVQNAGDHPLNKPVKKQGKEADKEKNTKYLFVDLPELTYPEKVYNIHGEDISSRELAEIVVNILNKINREIQTTYDKFKMNALNDKKRYYVMYTLNGDINQFIEIKKR
jgi:hypothetical protein